MYKRQKYPLSHERSQRSSLSTYPLPVHTKVPPKPPLLRGERSKPRISTPLSLERSERSSPFYIPLTGAFKSATKTTTFERQAKCALKSAPSNSSKAREVSISTYPLLLTTTFERRVERGLTNGCGHSSIYCISAINLILYNDFTFLC